MLTISVACNVSSTSGPDGEQVLQVFHRASPEVIGRVNGSHPVPLKALVGFERFSLSAGATVPVLFELDRGSALGLVDAQGSRVEYAGLHLLDVWDGGSNNVTLQVEAPEDRVLAVPPKMKQAGGA